MKKIDACGLTCPEPVLKAKKIIEDEHPAHLTIVVDNAASNENVGRFLISKGYLLEKHMDGDVFVIAASKDGDFVEEEQAPKVAKTEQDTDALKTVILITSDKMGSGDDDLGRKLMINYIKTIKELGENLWQLIFLNSAVKLTTSDSPVLAEVKEYEKAGCIILACGTCLEHYGLMDEKQVGETTNMLDIVMAGQAADKFISIG
ncbi:MAG: sulfurtransferase-like selenium metabolism protein YedF [Desulfotalea sp.]